MPFDYDSDDSGGSVCVRRTPSPESTVYEMQQQRYDVFKEQDFVNGNFDLTFDFNGKHLYVHKFAIMPVSETFNSMLSIRWSKDAKVVKVENYSYDDFFQFISFLYSGKCLLKKTNIYALVDMAEYYGVSSLKTRCDIFLSKMHYDIEGIYDMILFGQRYSLTDFNRSLRTFFFHKFYTLVNAEKFLTLDKTVIEILSAFERYTYEYEEDFFKAVCKWAEHQALSKQAEPDKTDFDLQQSIKNELAEILPHIHFSRMKFSFVTGFVVEHKFLFSAHELYMLLCNSRRVYNSCYEEQELFQKVCEMAEKNVSERMLLDDSIVFTEAMKMELEPVIPRIHFSYMKFSFLKEFLEDKQFLFSPSKLLRIFSKCSKVHDEHSEAFEMVYELAENQAFELKNLSSDRNFDLNEAIKNKMAQVINHFDYCYMSLDFVLTFLVPKKFLFTPQKLYRAIVTSRNDDEERCFDAVNELIEADAKEQLLTANQELSLNDIIKERFLPILYLFNFSRMTLDYMIDTIVENRMFLFVPSNLYYYLLNAKRDPDPEKRSAQEEKFFKTVYELAEKNALEKQQTNQNENFDLKVAVKEELTNIISGVKFFEMKLPFLVDFVVIKGFTFSDAEMYQIFLSFRKRYNNEKEALEAIYQLAEAQAKEKISIDENLNLIDTVKADLAITIPNVQFYKMSKTFLSDFVVNKGILSEEEAGHVFDYRLVVENNGKTLTGAFVDIFGIKDVIGPKGYELRVLSAYKKQRFTRLKFKVPSTPSAIKKMKGVDWYLVLEKNGILALVSSNNVARSDYIIAEMRTQDEFAIPKGSNTLLKSYFNDDAADDN